MRTCSARRSRFAALPAAHVCGLGTRRAPLHRLSRPDPGDGAEEYASFYARITPIHGECDLHRAYIERILAEVEGPAVLDAGCGRGHLARLIAGGDPGKKVVGADLAPPAAYGSPNLAFVEGWLERLPFPDKSFDTVLCTHAEAFPRHRRRRRRT